LSIFPRPFLSRCLSQKLDIPFQSLFDRIPDSSNGTNSLSRKRKVAGIVTGRISFLRGSSNRHVKCVQLARLLTARGHVTGQLSINGSYYLDSQLARRTPLRSPPSLCLLVLTSPGAEADCDYFFYYGESIIHSYDVYFLRRRKSRQNMRREYPVRGVYFICSA